MIRTACAKVCHWMARLLLSAGQGCKNASVFFSDAEEWFSTSATWAEIREAE